jgi:hypothetical protein
MGEKMNAYRILVGGPRRRWMDNIKMDLREIGWDGVDWIDMAQDRDQWRAPLFLWDANNILRRYFEENTAGTPLKSRKGEIRAHQNQSAHREGLLDEVTFTCVSDHLQAFH